MDAFSIITIIVPFVAIVLRTMYVFAVWNYIMPKTEKTDD
jgi:hypothetical protein